MATVSQKTLGWLWNVLQREYRDPRRVYGDLAQALSVYPNFAPRTDVYTYENGVSALLLHLSGTVPVAFRGTQYRFPVAIWIPYAYPYESPIVYVMPTEDMVIRPGQHVSPSDGKIYHPYLANWREASDRSNVVDVLKMLADIFAREPPVMARQQSSAPPERRMPQNLPQQQPPPRPPGPYDQRPPSAIQSAGVQSPPTPPPKPGQQLNGTGIGGQAATQSPRMNRYDAPPPLPGQDEQRRQPTMPLPPSQARHGAQWQPPIQQPQPLRHGPTHNQSALTPHRQAHYGASVADHQPIAVAHQIFPSQQPQMHNQQNFQYQPPMQNVFLPQQLAESSVPQSHAAPYQPQIPRPKPAEPNIMDESPFDVSLRAPSSNLPTPAIPPNPEKQHILQTLQTTLLSNLQTQIGQTTTAIGPLRAQHSALQEAQNTLQQELNQLQALQSQLQQNVTSLNTTITSADRTVSNARNESSPSKIPSIDELIVPPNPVARQLYDNVAEQRGYEAAIYALTEGFVRGRLGYEIWVRKTRECAREEFRRKWLVRRIGKGMGLDMSQTIV